MHIAAIGCGERAQLPCPVVSGRSVVSAGTAAAEWLRAGARPAGVATNQSAIGWRCT